MPPMSTISAPWPTTSRDPLERLVLGPGGALVVERVGRAVDDRHHQRPVVGERVAAEPQRHPSVLRGWPLVDAPDRCRSRASAAARIWVAIPDRSRRDWCRWARVPRSTWAIASRPRPRWVSTRAASSTAYPRRDVQLLEDRASDRPLTRERLVQPAELREQQPDQRPRDQLGDPAALERYGVLARAHRPLVEALDQPDLGPGEQRPEQARARSGCPSRGGRRP